MSKEEIFESGEKELMKAFEDVTVRNVMSIRDYSIETRRIVRSLENEVKHFRDLLIMKDKELELLRNQLANIQSKLYVGGTE